MKKEVDSFWCGWKINNKNIIEMECTSCACPVQFEGKLKNGRFFYFRERHGWTSFRITENKPAWKSENKAIFKIIIPEEHFPFSASQRISEWVDFYFKELKEEKEFFKENQKQFKEQERLKKECEQKENK